MEVDRLSDALREERDLWNRQSEAASCQLAALSSRVASADDLAQRQRAELDACRQLITK
jgi:hypothetical protein